MGERMGGVTNDEDELIEAGRSLFGPVQRLEQRAQECRRSRAAVTQIVKAAYDGDDRGERLVELWIKRSKREYRGYCSTEQSGGRCSAQLGEARFKKGGLAVRVAFQKRDDQSLLVREVLIQRANADARHLGDLSDVQGLEAPSHENASRSLDDGVDQSPRSLLFRDLAWL